MGVATKKHQTRYGKERRLTFSVAGMNYRVTPSTQVALSENAPIMVKLVREPENTHDPNAIAVYLETYRKGMHIGFVPRQIAESLAPLMDENRVAFTATWLTSIDFSGHTGKLLVVLRKKLSPTP